MLVIPSIDVAGGRSRLVHWPGAATGEGSPTDRPERIAERFVAQGARQIHLVDLDGARAGKPENLDAIGRVAARVGVPLQVAGHPGVATVVGTLHGFLYIVYLFVAFQLTRTLHIPVFRTILVLIAGTVPFGAIIAERRLTSEYSRQVRRAAKGNAATPPQEP